MLGLVLGGATRRLRLGPPQLPLAEEPPKLLERRSLATGTHLRRGPGVGDEDAFLLYDRELMPVSSTATRADGGSVATEAVKEGGGSVAPDVLKPSASACVARSIDSRLV